MPICQECHHNPSGRFNADGEQCYCTCHNVADAAPELLAALEESLALNINWSETAEADDLDYYSEYRAVIKQARAAIAKAKGQS